MENIEAKIIEKVRKQKNISVKCLVEGIMAPSTYHRFKNGEVEPSYKKFYSLLSRLNMKHEEFLFISNHYQADKLKSSLFMLEELFNNKDIEGLRKFKESNVDNADWDNPLACEHVIMLSNLFENYLKGDKVDLNNELIQYLEKTETWTHYEIVMFNNVMKFMPTETIDFFLNNIIRSLIPYEKTDDYNHEISRILINAIISFLSRKKILLAKKWYKHLSNQNFNENFLFERFFRKLIGQYIKYADGNYQCKESFPLFVDYLNFLEGNK